MDYPKKHYNFKSSRNKMHDFIPVKSRSASGFLKAWEVKITRENCFFYSASVKTECNLHY